MSRILLLGGLDPSGGAGITLDATVGVLHGVTPLPVATTLTVQGRRGFVAARPVVFELLRQQLEVVLEDGPVQAIKVGLLGDVGLLVELATLLRPLAASAPLVVDPVMSATAGGFAAPAALAAAYREHLLPLTHLVTPNLPELAALGGEVSALLADGAAAVLAKGGHGDGDEAIDVLHTAAGAERFVRPRHDTGPVRGTGCALATAVAARLARGEALGAACRGAGDWLAGLLARVRPRPSGLPRHLPLPPSV